VYPPSLLGSGSVKTLPWQRIHMQECKNCWTGRFLCGGRRIKGSRQLLIVIAGTCSSEGRIREFGLFKFPFRFLLQGKIGRESWYGGITANMLIDHKHVHNMSLVTQHLFSVINIVYSQMWVQHRARLSFTMRVTADEDRVYCLSVVLKYYSV
jgi:hypothetical protein